MNDRISIINYLIQLNQYNSYLEIGVDLGECFSKIKIKSKIGVDPAINKYVTYQMTSNDFFKQLDKNTKFDIIFIDGLHESEQVYKDIIQSLDHLSDNGTIVCHDMNPELEIYQFKKPYIKLWNGDCWKAFVKLRSERNDLEMYTIDTDYGVSIIKPSQIKYDLFNLSKSELSFYELDKNRIKYLNLISVNDFIKKSINI